MKETFAQAKLTDWKTIKVFVLSDSSLDPKGFILICDGHEKTFLTPYSHFNEKKTAFYEFRLSSFLPLGHSYHVFVPSIGLLPLEVNELANLPDFDKKFSYDGSLGYSYSKKSTAWHLWAPLASKVRLRLFDGEKKGIHQMDRGEKGVYSLTLEGDFQNVRYTFLITNNENEMESIDPYAKASTSNGQQSVVLDLEAFGLFKRDKYVLPVYDNPSQCIIYEGNVRDLTSDRAGQVKNRGTFLGLTDSGTHTKKGHPSGLDYLLSLGFTHLQLQPINDFANVNEDKKFSDYNWGYDPSQYFVPEGSYSLNPNDPSLRLQEARAMIDSFHEKGLRVCLDVVYNHIFDYALSSLEKCVPNYFFRKDSHGRMSNSSWCGNDIDTERPMARRLIVDSAKWWIDFYGIDGFRFDLMGLIDQKTISLIESYGKEKDPSFLVYGEGWNMETHSKAPMANLNYAKKTPSLSFFNDSFREAAKAVLAGDLGKINDLIYSMLGSSFEWNGRYPMFALASQSLNYIECHDNATFYDFLSKTTNLSENDKMMVCKLGMAMVAFSFGMPFFHEGQELCQSKFGNENTYNSPDVYNRLSYALLDERKEIVQYLRDAIALRKKLSFFGDFDQERIEKCVDFTILDKGFVMHVAPDKPYLGFLDFDFLFNPSSEAIAYSYRYDRAILFTGGGLAIGANLLGKNVLVPKHSILVTALPMKEN